MLGREPETDSEMEKQIIKKKIRFISKTQTQEELSPEFKKRPTQVVISKEEELFDKKEEKRAQETLQIRDLLLAEKAQLHQDIEDTLDSYTAHLRKLENESWKSNP